VFWVKYHFKTDQGIKCLTDQDAARIVGEDPNYCHRDLFAAIEREEFPSWTLKKQIMPAADAAKYRNDPFDMTKVWPYRDYPLIPVGKLVLNRNRRITLPRSNWRRLVRHTSSPESDPRRTGFCKGDC
jgi:catalase